MNWEKFESLADLGQTLAILGEIYTRIKGKPIREAVREAGATFTEHHERVFAAYLRDEVRVMRLAGKIPNKGKRVALRNWLANLEHTRPHSHVRVILALAQMTQDADGAEQDTINYMEYLGGLRDDNARNDEMVGYGVIKANENEYLGVQVQEFLRNVKAFAQNPRNRRLAQVHAVRTIRAISTTGDGIVNNLRSSTMGRITNGPICGFHFDGIRFPSLSRRPITLMTAPPPKPQRFRFSFSGFRLFR